MKIVACIILLFGFLQDCKAQNNSGYRIMSSSLGSSGSSQHVVTTNGTYKISQSIGQTSVIGTHFNNGYYLRQGYQQPLGKLKISKTNTNDLDLLLYPNPFKESVTIKFNSAIQDNVLVRLFSVQSKLIYAKEFLPAQEIKLLINDISTGTYFLKINSGRLYFGTKLIKL